MNILPTYKEMVSAAITTAGIVFLVDGATEALSPVFAFLPAGTPSKAIVTFGVVLATQKVANMF